jgi:preprotein translocase subunit YajC
MVDQTVRIDLHDMCRFRRKLFAQHGGAGMGIAPKVSLHWHLETKNADAGNSAPYGIISGSITVQRCFLVLNWLFPAAYAQDAAAGAQAPGAIFNIALPMLLIAVFYFFIIRPQSKRAKEQRDMMSKLAKGDEVIVTGGLAGKIVGIGEVYLTLEIADKVEVKVQKAAVTSVLPKGSLKSL